MRRLIGCVLVAALAWLVAAQWLEPSVCDVIGWGVFAGLVAVTGR